MKTFK